jgi:hypothetical protein
LLIGIFFFIGERHVLFEVVIFADESLVSRLEIQDLSG